MEDLLIKIFCDVDDFCIRFDKYLKSRILNKVEIRHLKICRSRMMNLSEVMTIVIFFHHSCYRTFKHYYKEYVCKILIKYFPNLVSYTRFVELMGEALIPLILYTKKVRVGKSTGISFIDSTTLDVCDNRRIHSHKVFKDIAQRGKSSTGWFYGFKLHLVINDIGEILSFFLTTGEVDDRDEKVIDILTEDLFGKLFGDKGYISQPLFERLYKRGIKLITKLKKNMKNKLVVLEEKLLLRKRALVETVNDFLKNVCQIEHTRHRSFMNFLVNIVAGIAAYSFLPKKPSLNLNKRDLIAIL